MEVTRAFGFVDLAGFTALAEAHGDAGAADVAGLLIRLTRRTLEPTAELVKSLGDAVMLAAPQAQALLDSVAGLAGLCGTVNDFPMLRGGLHHGTAQEKGGDYFGRAVNVASRVAGRARAGEILLTEQFLTALKERPDLPLTSLGPVRLRGVLAPVDVHAWTLDHEHHPVDPVCRMRVTTPAGTLRYGGWDYVFCSLECAGLFTANPANYVTAPT